MAGLFGMKQGEQHRGPRARRGDVRAAILDVLQGEPLNGYQVISAISERTGGAWKPSPGSVYPTISQLEDEGLVEADDERGRRTLRLTDAGREYVAANADELDGVWKPFAEPERPDGGDFATLKPEIGQVMNAVWQIISTGTDQQRRDAIDVLVETRRKLYGLLAEGEPVNTSERAGPADQRRRARAGRRRPRRALRAGPDHDRGAPRAARPDLGGPHPPRAGPGLRRPAGALVRLPAAPPAQRAPRRPGWRRIPTPLLVLLVVLVAVTAVTHLPLILIGIGLWFLLSRGVCGARPHRRW